VDAQVRIDLPDSILRDFQFFKMINRKFSEMNRLVIELAKPSAIIGGTFGGYRELFSFCHGAHFGLCATRQRTIGTLWALIRPARTIVIGTCPFREKSPKCIGRASVSICLRGGLCRGIFGPAMSEASQQSHSSMPTCGCIKLIFRHLSIQCE